MQKNIIRVFPKRTKLTPDDDLVFVGMPPGLLLPPHDEVHVSCTFTWDKAACEDLQKQWEMFTDKPVLLGGPAYNSPCIDFVPGRYVKTGVIFTSRGCNNNCPFCFVPDREGFLRELPVFAGNIVQDNNFLQTSREHQEKVFAMLKTQSKICFKGGLQNDLIDTRFIEAIKGLRIAELWLACDSANAIPGFTDAAAKLVKAGYNHEKIKCYALIGDDMDENENRLQTIYKAGAMPFAMLYQPPNAKEKKKYGTEWRKFQAMWCRPAATIAHVERGTSMWDYDT